MRIAVATAVCVFAGFGLISFATGDKDPVVAESTVVAEPMSSQPLTARFDQNPTYRYDGEPSAVQERGWRGSRANDAQVGGQGQGRYQLRDGSGSGAGYGREGATRGRGHHGKSHGRQSGGQGRGGRSGSCRGRCNGR